MKTSIIAVILSLTVSGTAFANTLPYHKISAVKTTGPNDIPYFRGKENFQEKFPQATDVNCKFTGQFTEVNFMWNGLQLQAFYDAAGEPVATSRTVILNSLPLYVQMSLKKQYPSYIVTDAAEFTDADDGLSYYVTVTGPKFTYLLHVSTSGTISVFKKMKQ